MIADGEYKMSDQKDVVRIKPSQFAESVFLLEGRPFRLGPRRYLLPIYNCDIEEGIIMSGRQVEKSTTNATKIATHTLTEPNFKALYVAPQNEQVKEFSRERIGKFYDYSQQDVVNKEFRTTNDINNVSMKQFSKNGSVNYFRHCYEMGDNIRGLTANGVWFDEVQDINNDAIPVVKECQSHALDAGAKMKITWYTGTPKTFSNTIQKRFEESTQNEWIVTCPHCRTHQILGIKNLTPTQFICRKCGKEIDRQSIENGKWLPMQRDKRIIGFRISQMMVPWITASDLWQKYESYSKGKFYNEVLGRSFEDAEKPFNMPLLQALCENDYYLVEALPREFMANRIYMGVDWGTGGKSYTVVTIFTYDKNGIFRLLYAKQFRVGDELDVDWQVNFICKLIIIFRVNLAVLDWGFGFVQNNTIKKKFGNRVAICYYSSNQNKKINYNKEKGMYVVNRTAIISEYVDFIRAKKAAWPGKSTGEISYLFDDHLAEFAEYRKSYNGRSEELMYMHSESTPDDGMHSCVYAWLGSKLDANKDGNNAAGMTPENPFSGAYMPNM